MVVDAGARRLSCPQCKNVVTVAAGQRPSCDACGYGAQAAPRAQPVHAAAAAMGQPAQMAAAPTGYGGGAGYGAAGYGATYQQTTYVHHAQPSSGMGVASMVLGIIGLVGGLPTALLVPFLGIFNVPALLAVIFGAVQLKRVKRDPARYGGAGMAKAGLIMGLIVFGLSIALSLAIIGLFGALMAGA